MRALREVAFLALDEIGLTASTEKEQTRLFELIGSRYNRRRPTSMATNATAAPLTSIGERTADRLREACVAVSISSDSHRGRAQRQGAAGRTLAHQLAEWRRAALHRVGRQPGRRARVEAQSSMTTRPLPTVEEVRVRLEAAGHYVTIDGRVTEQTAATLIPCPASRLRRWRLEGKGPRFYRPAKTPWYYLGDVLDWIEGSEALR